jgi:hypothetical protein
MSNRVPSFNVSDEGLVVSLPKTAFGCVAVAEKTPMIQVSFDGRVSSLDFDFATTNGGYCGMSNGMLTCSSHGGTNGTAVAKTLKIGHYNPGQGLLAQFSGIFTPGVVDNARLLGYGDITNGFFVGYIGTTFSLTMRTDRTGSVVDNVYSISDWNGNLDKAGVSFDPTKSNVYFIRAQLHFMGSIDFILIDGIREVLMHRIQWNDQLHTGVTLRTASLPFYMSSVNSNSSTANATVQTASVGIFTEGHPGNGRQPFAHHVEVTGVTTEETLYVLRNRSTVLGQVNHGEIYITSVQAGTTGNQPGAIRFYKNVAQWASTPTFVPKHGATMAEIATNSGIFQADPAVDTVAAVTAGDPTTQITLTNLDASALSYVGYDAIFSETSRKITADDSGNPAKITMAGFIDSNIVAETTKVYLHNGYIVHCMTLGKDASSVNSLNDHEIIKLAPGESITVTAQSSATAKIKVGLGWIEKY